ncbi:hypothetical protein FACS1894211_03970 [Clostridia bacterium]|nr:hypothetical protein FACS1894211_03970 [Clostridia bacterium]
MNKAMNRYLKSAVIGVLCLAFILSGFTLPARGAPSVRADAPESALVLSASADAVTAHIGAGVPLAGLRLVRFKAREYHGSADFIPFYDGVGDNNDLDGYATDRNYYDPDATGFLEADVTARTVTFPRISTAAGEEGFDKLYDKYYLLTGGSVAAGRVSGGTVVAGPKFITEFVSDRTFVRQTASSIKGIEAVNYDDAEKLGVKHSSVGIDINSILTTATAADAIPFTSNGKTYYFSRNTLSGNDRQVKGMSDAGFIVTQLMLIWASRIGVSSILPHPDFVRIPTFPLNICAPNVTTDLAVGTYIAVYEFLAERYTRPDQLYGRVSNFVIGNEVESACQWNNMGYMPLDEYIRQYERAVRLAFLAIKSRWSNANVMICCSHFWNLDVATQFGNYDSATYEPFIGKGSFTTKQILTNFARVSREEGDYPWLLAYHPYRANAIGESVFWNDVNYEASQHNEDAPKVTPLNIDVLANYLKKDFMTYNGAPRDFYVTEYGAGTPHRGYEYDPDALTDEDLDTQVASYIYSYYMLYFHGAKSYILHRQIDYIAEDGENLGIWTRAKNSGDIYKKKPLWEVMRYIDTERSYEYTAPYLKFIKKYPSDESPKSWSEIIPGFSVKKLEKSPLPVEKALTTDKYDAAGKTGFEDGNADGWTRANAATNAVILNADAVAATGRAGLAVDYSSTGGAGGGLAEKGIEKRFENGVDLSGKDRFYFSLKLVTNTTGIVNTVRVRFYSGENVVEHKIAAPSDDYERYAAVLDNGDWAFYDKVDKIKIWYSSDRLNAPSGMMYFDDIGFRTAAGPDNGGAGGGGSTAPAKGPLSSAARILIIAGSCVIGAAAVMTATLFIFNKKKEN